MSWTIIPASRVKKRSKSGNAQEVLDRLNSFLTDEMEGPAEIMCGFWKEQQNAISYQELREAVLTGDITEETYQAWSNDYAALVKERFNGIWESAIAKGSTSQPIMDKIADSFVFNTQSPGILEWIADRGATLVTNSTLVQTEAIRALLEERIRERYGVDELARLIRPCVGLTVPQTQSARKFYDRAVEKLIKDHPRMSDENIRKNALKSTSVYAERLHRQRAVTIARTELASAYNHGADLGIRQAQADYLIGTCIKKWSTALNENVCPTCEALEGTEAGMDEEFFSGAKVSYTNGMFPPAHPSCACAVEYIEISPPVLPPEIMA